MVATFHNHGLEIQGGATVGLGIFTYIAEKAGPLIHTCSGAVTIVLGVVTLVGIYRKWRRGEW